MKVAMVTESVYPEVPVLDIAALERGAARDAWHVEGVAGPQNRFLQMLRLKGYPKSRVWLDRHGKINVDLRIVALYGTDLGLLGSKVQDAVHESIRRVTDTPINKIRVRVVRVVSPKTL